mgnify:CR=1 FL=1
MLVAWTMIVWIVARRDSESIKKVLEARKESHKKEIETMSRKLVAITVRGLPRMAFRNNKFHLVFLLTSDF